MPQKTTNMVHDIEGTAPGTGGLGGCAIKMYRKQKQVAIRMGDLGDDDSYDLGDGDPYDLGDDDSYSMISAMVAGGGDETLGRHPTDEGRRRRARRRHRRREGALVSTAKCARQAPRGAVNLCVPNEAGAGAGARPSRALNFRERHDARADCAAWSVDRGPCHAREAREAAEGEGGRRHTAVKRRSPARGGGAAGGRVPTAAPARRFQDMRAGGRPAPADAVGR